MDSDCRILSVDNLTVAKWMQIADRLLWPHIPRENSLVSTCGGSALPCQSSPRMKAGEANGFKWTRHVTEKQAASD